MNVLAVGDTHAPFHNEHACDFVADLIRHYKINAVVHIGDLGDQHGWSRHERQPDAPGQGDEDRQCLEFCREFYKVVRRMRVKKACIGNHDIRLAKKCVRAGIPSRLHVTVPEIYDSPKWLEWGEGFTIDGIAYMHGDGYSGLDAALKAARDNRISTVIGHIHSVGGVRFVASQFSRVFGCSTGCLVDPTSIGMSYAKRAPARPVLGSAVILDGLPLFVPMVRECLSNPNT